MRRTVLAASLLLLAAASPVWAQMPAGAPSTDLAKAPSGPLEMDTRHTQVVFTIVRGGLINVYGRFDKNSGTLNFDTAKPENSQLNVTIDMTSISMMVPELNTMLQGKDVMDTADFPTATFKSTSVVRTGPNAGNVTGDMTFRGKTRPVTFAVVYSGTNGNQVGFHATATIKRSDFGMTEMRFSPLISDTINLIIEGQFQKPRGQ
jgi:polyisoprenoid-binding protein YceI